MTFFPASNAQKSTAAAFISAIPLLNLQEAGDSGSIGTLFTGNASGTSFTLEREPLPSDAFFSEVQVQINGINGNSGGNIVGAVLVQGTSLVLPPSVSDFDFGRSFILKLINATGLIWIDRFY